MAKITITDVEVLTDEILEKKMGIKDEKIGTDWFCAECGTAFESRSGKVLGYERPLYYCSKCDLHFRIVFAFAAVKVEK